MKTQLALAGAILLPVAALAQPTGHSLVLTETGTTTLSATLDGSSLPITVDIFSRTTWLVTMPYTLAGLDPVDFPEPDGNGYNSIGAQFGLNLTVGSDVANAFRISTGPAVIGQDPSGIDVIATFIDRGDAAGVPDVQSTLPLLLFSVFSLLAVARPREVRQLS